MKTISHFILTKALGWKIKGDFQNIKKSVFIFAPHTSLLDSVYGKLYMMSTQTSCRYLTKKEAFIFPFNLVLQAFGFIPVDKNKNYIDHIVEMFRNNSELHIVISPEGQFAKTTHWRKGFYYMATQANVPIVVGFIDYKKKELGIKEIMNNINCLPSTMKTIATIYKDINARHPERFALDNRFWN